MSDLEPSGQFVVYGDELGTARIDMRFDGDTAWLTQAQLVQLFDSSKANISEHISNILTESELDEDRTVRDFRSVGREGSRDVQQTLTQYSLDMIISVGYRVRSKTAAVFYGLLRYGVKMGEVLAIRFRRSG